MTRRPAAARAALVASAALMASAALVALAGCGKGRLASPPAAPAAPAAPSPPPPPEPLPSPEPEAAEPSGPRTPVETVTIKLLADARRQAHVIWGRKDLGVAPLELKRPRGSGPVDLLVVAPGALPLHTRVFTDRDETLPLRFYSSKEAAGLLGWKPSEPDSKPGPAPNPR